MYEFGSTTALSGDELFRELHSGARALVDGEPDAVANMANIAALIAQLMPDLNWAGFYRVISSELVLGPFIGKPACIRIALGQGVCGTAAAMGTTQRIDDVHAFPGHIACDAASASELVVPVKRDGAVIAVIDLDSPQHARFSDADARAFETLADIVAAAI